LSQTPAGTASPSLDHQESLYTIIQIAANVHNLEELVVQIQA